MKKVRKSALSASALLQTVEQYGVARYLSNIH